MTITISTLKLRDKKTTHHNSLFISRTQGRELSDAQLKGLRDLEVRQLLSVTEHSHDPDPNKVKAAKAKNIIKLAALTNRSRPAHIVTDATCQQPRCAIGRLDSVKCNVRRLQKRTLPKDPTSLRELEHISDEVGNGMDYLLENIPDVERLEGLVDYFSSTYVFGTCRRFQPPALPGGVLPPLCIRRIPPLFPPQLWNVHQATTDGEDCTNNLCENWNFAFHEFVGHDQLTTQPSQRLKNLCLDYVNERKTLKEFLNGVGRLAAALDRANTSDRQAVHIVAATVADLGRNIGELLISRSTIRRACIRYRRDHIASVKQTVISSGAKTGIVVHWDGKLLPSLTGEESVERLSILISGKEVSSSIFMFQHQFQLTIKEKKLIQTMSLFVALVYGPMWFKAPGVFGAPSNDISFLKQLHYYGEKIDESVGMAATKAFQRHLWYLSEESVALALFSDSVSYAEKREILESMKGKNEKKECPKMLKVTEGEIPSLELKNLASTNINCFFQTTLLDSGFFSKDPSQWNDDPQFLQSREILQELQVVNDVAERAVKVIQDYNSSITKSEDQKQYLLQVVTTHRHTPSAVVDPTSQLDLLELREKLGYTGEELRKFISDWNQSERQEIAEKREAEKEKREAEDRRLQLQREADQEKREAEKGRLKLHWEIEKTKLSAVQSPGSSLNNAGLRLCATTPKPKLPIYDENIDDVDAYLDRFERYATTNGVVLPETLCNADDYISKETSDNMEESSLGKPYNTFSISCEDPFLDMMSSTSWEKRNTVGGREETELPRQTHLPRYLGLIVGWETGSDRNTHVSSSFVKQLLLLVSRCEIHSAHERYHPEAAVLNYPFSKISK
ncbi:putative Inosine-5'-monophosphate dehydrogenase 1b-like 7 [Homarus americanus]|uniref:Putative Inosine-5'-monophosphate dehydrogenase 1b-like 7 n=1 Tax=Homarus americanus TaxID=6706 RepID=A0A8J5T287_HOMAM|nr:putative Inosine-5'-monophosphate dehydrogenase 1b-like 7 [Homarus americanus]